MKVIKLALALLILAAIPVFAVVHQSFQQTRTKCLKPHAHPRSNTSHADFTWDREVHVRGRLGWAFNYRVSNEYGTPVINRLISATLMAGYSGRVVIDPETKDILEISSTLESPDRFPIQNV